MNCWQILTALGFLLGGIAPLTLSHCASAQEPAAGAKADPSTESSGANQQASPKKKKPPTAKDYYEDGVAAFAGEEFQLAKQQLEKAIELDPKYVDAHYKLGATHFRLRKFGPAWSQFRKANQLDPEHKQALFGFLQLWSFYETARVLDVGLSPHRVTSVLGQPDRELSRGAQKRLTYNFMVINFVDNRLHSVLDTRDFSRDKAVALERIDFSFDNRDWKPISRKVNSKQAIVEHVPSRQSSRNMLEQVKIQRAIGLRLRGLTARRFAASLKSSLQQQNPSLQWNIIDDGTNDLIFEWRTEKTDQSGKKIGMHALARAIGGEKDVHLLTYRKQVPQMNATHRTLWIDRLRGAKLVPVKKKAAN